ncbi:UspA domain protein [Natronomonas moolapensis 8.8.11]|jgi:nucleotide-binding universal stress UspA family protein|uniref:UspA domain protein n=1 Tax=Natronomonas moolapensis (strain DSM 18674 / CECT 7526 / JCM 14361 / 8.8.11) TaxID=268739 RepID=M1XS24_NATM8|nr:universal stress protein [Natronomonas moolapensis]CCQ37051.1 UspA domain protein [Natronomonas moolapensis 8.8.11]
MTFVVPFDGSKLAETALVRAREFSDVLEEESVVAVVVVPNENTEYARDRGWLRPEEPFETDSVVERLHKQVMALAPSADFRHLAVDRYAPLGTIASAVRDFANETGASMVFIGSENAGHMVTGISSVGSNVATEDAYDVVIIRNKTPSKIAAIRDSSPYKPPKSDFYIS